LESAKTRIKNYPLEVSEDAALINAQALESIAKSIEERRGSIDRDVFLKEISSIFDISEKEKKRIAKNKTISEAAKRKIEKRKLEDHAKLA
jgi:L-arabinose isomerase